MITFAQLCGAEPQDSDRPPLDRIDAFLRPSLTANQNDWLVNGVLIKENFIPDELIKRYRSVRDQVSNPGGWKHPTPYFENPEIRDICLFPELVSLQQELFGVPMGLHLNLTGYISTERQWHQDRYLNPDHVNDYYVAAWLALDDIHPDSGPFQYVAGSHRWPVMSRDALFKVAPPDLLDPQHWPSQTQGIVGAACQGEIDRRGAEIVTHLPKKGTLLLWHSRLMHRGSKPNVPGTPRKALIAHYSAIDHRPDMPSPVQHGAGFYFPIDTRSTYTSGKDLT